MNEKNLEYLKNSLKYLGFGDKLDKVLESAINQRLSDFKISLNNTVALPRQAAGSEPRPDFIQYNLNFSKSKESDMYFLNNYEAKLSSYNHPDRNHIFNLNQNHWTTAKEAYNLLSGRSVNKEIAKEGTSEKLSVWTKLDVDVKDARGNFPSRYFYPNYGFDLEAAVSKYPIKGLDDAKVKGSLISSLKKGDLATAEMVFQGKKIAVLISANPEMKSLNILDSKMRVVKDNQIWPELAKEKGRTSNNGDAHDRVKVVLDIDASPEQTPWQQNTVSKERSVKR